MRNSQKLLSLITGCVLTVGLATSASAQSAAVAQNVGVVDRDKVVTSYPKAKQAAEELKKSEESVHKLIETSNKKYEEAKTARKPPAELEGLQRRLQKQIDTEVRKVQARAQELEKQLENDIDAAIKTEATSRKVDVVILKQAVLLGGTDLTDGVIKRLNTVASASGGAKK